MDNKTLSIVSYITIIGWIIAFVIGKDKADDLLKFHLKQGLGLVIFSFIWLRLKLPFLKFLFQKRHIFLIL